MSGHVPGHGSVTFDELANILDAGSIDALRSSKDRTVALDDRMSIWELCELVREASFSAVPANENGNSSCCSDDGAASDDSLAEDPSIDNFVNKVRLELFPEKSTDSDESIAGDFADGPCCVRGQWSPDGGPGTAQNPQVQLETDRVTLLRAELRAKLPEPSSTLELWLLQGTRWGKRVKQLASDEKEEDKGEEQVLKKGMTKRAQTMLKAEEAEESGTAKLGACRVFKILASAQSLTHRPGPIRVQLEVEVKAKETLTFVLARGRHQLQPATATERPPSSGSEAADRSGSQTSRRPSHQRRYSRQSTTLETPTRRGSASARRSISGDAENQALNKVQSRGSVISIASKGSSGRKSPSGRRSSVGRRGSQTFLPALPVANLDEDEVKEKAQAAAKLVTIAPEILCQLSN